MRPIFPPSEHQAAAHYDMKTIEAIATSPAAFRALPLVSSLILQHKLIFAETIGARPVITLARLSSGIVVLVRLSPWLVARGVAPIVWAFGHLESESVSL